jgi:predicted nuclease with TOPRIM domain
MEYLDTMDLKERLEELEGERADLREAVDDAEGEEEKQTAQEKLDSWEGDNLKELEALRGLRDEVSEWGDDDTLVMEEDWIDYVEEMVEEMLKDYGYLPPEIPWYIEIDWEIGGPRIIIGINK